MPWTPAKLTKQQLEQRRFAAIESFKNSTNPKTQIQIARELGVTPAAISQWRKAFNQNGDDSLKAKPHPGPGRSISPEDIQELKELLLKNPQEFGFTRIGWTTAMIAELIENEFGVSYHPDHVGKLLHSIGFSKQKPKTRGKKRDESKITTWLNETFPALKKNGLDTQ
jgi:putative transposase